MSSGGLIRRIVAVAVTALLAAGMAPAGATPSDGRPTSVRKEPLRLYAGTQPAAPAVGIVTERSLVTADGLRRTYRLFVPEGLSSRAPLLVALHGGLGSGQQFEASSDFNGLATANGFIVVYPDGVARFPDGSGGARTWNAGKCCGPAVARKVDDVAFLRAVVADVAASHLVDRFRVYAAGHSNGGMMALRMACEASSVFAAVGIQSASLEAPTCSPRHPVSLIQIHGTADTNIPIAGGKGSGIAGVAFAPPRQATKTLARADDCRAKPQRLRDTFNRDLLLSRWRTCSPGTGVVFLAVNGASHAWMGRPSLSPWADEYTGKPYMKLDSSRAIWAFLAAHSREQPR
jgi:polyhydroxybutyrate depolymerase